MDMSYENIDIEKEGISRDDLAKIIGGGNTVKTECDYGMTLPQIVINEKPIGGFSELLQLNNTGKLKELLKDD